MHNVPDDVGLGWTPYTILVRSHGGALAYRAFHRATDLRRWLGVRFAVRLNPRGALMFAQRCGFYTCPRCLQDVRRGWGRGGHEGSTECERAMNKNGATAEGLAPAFGLVPVLARLGVGVERRPTGPALHLQPWADCGIVQRLRNHMRALASTGILPTVQLLAALHKLPAEEDWAEGWGIDAADDLARRLKIPVTAKIRKHRVRCFPSGHKRPCCAYPDGDKAMDVTEPRRVEAVLAPDAVPECWVTLVGLPSDGRSAVRAAPRRRRHSAGIGTARAVQRGRA